jgi:NADH-quinone oxidoreductase subunit N
VQLNDVLPAVPEIFLCCAAMALLILGVFKGDNSGRLIGQLSVLTTLLATVLVACSGSDIRTLGLNDLFVVDAFGDFMKVLILIATALTLIMSLDYLEKESMLRPEYPVLVLFASLGMIMMVSANDLMALYVGLELQSLSLYVIAAFRRDTVRSSEAGLKYFVLGALSSGLYLYGASLVYGFTGTTDFSDLAMLLGADSAPLVGVVVGLTFIVAALCFKVSAVPFHMWTPDVYEGAPTNVTAFFAVAPKIAAIALFTRVLIGPFIGLKDDWQQILVFVSMASMLLGSFAAMAQSNIKRLMAYSSIGHIGFALVGLAAGTPEGVKGLMTYMAVYLFMNVGTFALILCMRINDRAVEDINDLAGIWKTNPRMALALFVFMFSMAGIPPLAGFLAKFYVFIAAIDAGLYTLAVVGVLASVVSAFYYLRIIKLAFFDEPQDAFDRPSDRGVTLVMTGSALVTVLLIAMPAFVGVVADAAARGLFAG